MIWLNFDTWNSSHGRFLSRYRIYKKGKWTPFCRIERRYDTRLGFWKKPEPDWKISIPNRRGDTASITYKGIPLRVISARLDLQANTPAVLMLEVWAHDLEAVIGALDIEINIVPKKAK